LYSAVSTCAQLAVFGRGKHVLVAGGSGTHQVVVEGLALKLFIAAIAGAQIRVITMIVITATTFPLVTTISVATVFGLTL
jgi:hypothetical protein